MLVTDVGDVKIYNLSAGKALPDWISDKKRREAQRKKADVSRRIELIQDFDMPSVATSIEISPDGQYILATGTYKPRIKCYDVNNLSLKFERCFDSEVVKFKILSEDYSKVVFLQADRFVEFHAAHGRHYRLRIPRFGRDLDYHKPSCDLFLVGTSSEIYRLNTERGQFLQPYSTSASSINACEVNPEHHLLCVGTQEGRVEAWDPRDKNRCGVLDVAVNIQNNEKFPSVSAIKSKNGLQMAVGTESGHVLLYDIRAREPLLVKNHLNQLAVRKIDFNRENNAVYSLDNAMLKIWDENTGKQIAYIESNSNFNDFTTSPKSGLLFFAQEEPKMMTYYIPSLGPAPRWCSFLDNLTEEIESESVQNIYDDYKFITKQELADLGLDHLEGTSMLRAYMHGFFIDIRLYNKAKAIADPFAFQRYRKEKIAKQIEESRPARLQLKSNLPKVNAELAEKLLTEQELGSSKLKSAASNLLSDDRFKNMFENPDFEVDKTAVEYRLLNPVLTRLDKSRAQKIKAREEAASAAAERRENEEDEGSTDDDLFSEKDESSDDDQTWTKEVKKEFKKINLEKKRERQMELDREEEDEDDGGPSIEVHEKEDFNIGSANKRISKAGLGKRLAASKPMEVKMLGGLGNCQMTFSTERKKSGFDKKRQAELKKHREERKKNNSRQNSFDELIMKEEALKQRDEMVSCLLEELVKVRQSLAESEDVIRNLKTKIQELEEDKKRLRETSIDNSVAHLQDELIASKLREAEASLSLKDLKQRVQELSTQWQRQLSEQRNEAAQSSESGAKKLLFWESSRTQDIQKLEEELMTTRIREMETLTELKELRLKVMELETQVQVSTNQLRRQDEESKKVKEELEEALTRERELSNKAREQQHRYSDLESRMKDELMNVKIKFTEQSQTVAELKQEISRLETKNSEMLAEGELRSNLDESDRVRDLQDKVAELKAELTALKCRGTNLNMMRMIKSTSIQSIDSTNEIDFSEMQLSRKDIITSNSTLNHHQQQQQYHQQSSSVATSTSTSSS